MKKLTADGMWVFSAKIFTGVAQIVIASILARMMAVADFAQFQAFQRIIIAGSILGSFGLATVSVRMVAEGLAKERPAQSYAVIMEIGKIVLTSSLAVALLFLLSGRVITEGLVGPVAPGVILVTAGLIVIVSLQQIVPEIFRGLHDIRFSSIFSGVATNSMFLLFLLFYGLWGSEVLLDNALMLYLLATFLVLVLAGVTLAKMIRPLKTGDTTVSHRRSEIVRAGKPMMYSLVILFIIKQADIWFITAIVSLDVAAYYAAASRLVAVLIVPLMMANAVIKPIIVQYLAQQQMAAMQTLLSRVARGAFVIGFVPALLMAVWPDTILGLLFGDYYSQGKVVLWILICSQLITLALGPCSIVLGMVGRERVILKATTFGAGTFLLTGALLLPLWDENGVALAVCVGTLTSQGMMMYACKKEFGVRTDIFTRFF